MVVPSLRGFGVISLRRNHLGDAGAASGAEALAEALRVSATRAALSELRGFFCRVRFSGRFGLWCFGVWGSGFTDLGKSIFCFSRLGLFQVPKSTWRVVMLPALEGPELQSQNQGDPREET